MLIRLDVLTACTWCGGHSAPAAIDIVDEGGVSTKNDALEVVMVEKSTTGF